MNKLFSVLTATFLLTLALTSCMSSATPTPEPFKLTSSAFQAETAIPDQYSCNGTNISPPLSWNKPPANTKSLAFIMDDPDAVKVVGKVWDHWLLFNIPATSLSLPEGVPIQDELADGSRHGSNSNPLKGYFGPCPPKDTHRYMFTLYALDTKLELNAGATKPEILKAMEGHILTQTVLAGLYTSKQ